MNTEGVPGLAWLPLVTGIALTLLLVAYPRFVVAADGRVDHPALIALAWAMTAGFVRGVGFVPRAALARQLLSGAACAIALGLGLLLLWLR